MSSLDGTERDSVVLETVASTPLLSLSLASGMSVFLVPTNCWPRYILLQNRWPQTTNTSLYHDFWTCFRYVSRHLLAFFCRDAVLIRFGLLSSFPPLYRENATCVRPSACLPVCLHAAPQPHCHVRRRDEGGRVAQQGGLPHFPETRANFLR